MKRWLREVWTRLSKWTGEIEDRGAQAQDGGSARRAYFEAQERSARVKGIQAEVRIITRKYQ